MHQSDYLLKNATTPRPLHDVFFRRMDYVIVKQKRPG
nr:MAG TPA: hypothetical protein [Caudoviricetes sp.]